MSDVHGFYYPLMLALNNAGFDADNSDHIFVSCGDLLDRGPNAVECLKFVNSLQSKILIRGNHEDLIEHCLIRRDVRSHDFSNGTYDTLLQISKEVSKKPITYSDEIFERVLQSEDYNVYINSVINFYETKSSIFVHGWIPCNVKVEYKSNYIYTNKNNWRQSSDEDWNSARWYNGMDCWNQGVRDPDKTIICGHWHCSWGNSKLHNDGVEFPNPRSTNPAHRYVNSSPFLDDGIVAIDACTALTHKVNCYVFEEN